MTKQHTAPKESALQKEKAQLQKLVRELKAENLKLQNKIAKIEAKYISATNRTKALEKLHKSHVDTPSMDELLGESMTSILEKVRSGTSNP